MISNKTSVLPRMNLQMTVKITKPKVKSGQQIFLTKFIDALGAAFQI